MGGLTMDRKHFKDNLEKLVVLFGVKEMSIERISLYWDYLKDFENEEFEKICKEIALTETFFPAVAVFYEKQKEIKNEPNRLPEWM